MFRTTYICSCTGNEIKQPSKTAINYIKTDFFIDFISTVHFDKIFRGKQDEKIIYFEQMLKLIRIFKIKKVINFTQNRPSLKVDDYED